MLWGVGRFGMPAMQKGTHGLQGIDSVQEA